jgi:predicted NAD-dependent protein-ADP-ribosyltransferase YbiA (DUF1768 family)
VAGGGGILVTSITSFSGKHRFLSNFYGDEHHHPLEYEFQAAKFTKQEHIDAIFACATPAKAKLKAQQMWADQRRDWESMSIQTMLGLLRKKFSPGSDLARRMFDTGEHYLEEGNTWGDTFYGTVNSRGSNVLGLLLMIVRAELRVLEPIIEEGF